MSGSEQVDRVAVVDPLLRGHDDIDEFGVAVLLHQGHDPSYGVDVDVHGCHLPGAVLPQVLVDRTLDDSVDEHVAFHVAGDLGPLQGDLDGFRGLLLGPERLGEDVQDCSDVGPYVMLELDDFLVLEVDLPVHVGLEGSGVGHDHAGIVQHLVQPHFQGFVPELGGVAYDVGVRDQGFESELLVQLAGRYRVDLGVDNRKKGGSLDYLAVDLEFAHARHAIALDDLEHGEC